MESRERSSSPDPSGVSLKSDRSMEKAPKLSDGGVTSDPSEKAVTSDPSDEAVTSDPR